MGDGPIFIRVIVVVLLEQSDGTVSDIGQSRLIFYDVLDLFCPGIKPFRPSCKTAGPNSLVFGPGAFRLSRSNILAVFLLIPIRLAVIWWWVVQSFSRSPG